MTTRPVDRVRKAPVDDTVGGASTAVKAGVERPCGGTRLERGDVRAGLPPIGTTWRSSARRHHPPSEVRVIGCGIGTVVVVHTDSHKRGRIARIWADRWYGLFEPLEAR